MKKIRSVLGILLILSAICGFILWEWKGREAVLTDEVLVAAEEIQKGTEVNASMFLVKGISKESLLEGALSPDDIGLLQGKSASQFIAKNGQIVLDYFTDHEFRLKRNESVFVLDPGWVTMRSSALRRGDLVDVYGTNGWGLLGSFRIAYVKDSAEREVRDSCEGQGKGAATDILDRPDSTSVIDHVEIISTFREYEYLLDCVSGATPAALIIVQRGENVDP